MYPNRPICQTGALISSSAIFCTDDLFEHIEFAKPTFAP